MSDGPAPRRAVRDLKKQTYPRSEQGKLAVDGSVLDKPGGDDNVIASAWFKVATDPKACPWCIEPRFGRMVDHWWRKCREHGQLVLPEEDPFPFVGRELELAEERAWQVILRREHVDVPIRYTGARLTGRQTPAVVAMREVLESEDLKVTTGLVTLAGPTGVGKSYAMAAAFRQDALHECDHNAVVYYAAAKLTRLLIRPGSDDVFDACLNAELLAIDDLGGNYVKEDGLAASLIEELVVEREAKFAATWFTTNHTAGSIAAAVGDRVADRLSGGTWFNLPGESLRRTAAGARATRG
jgi:hypothetical protein